MIDGGTYKTTSGETLHGSGRKPAQPQRSEPQEWEVVPYGSSFEAIRIRPEGEGCLVGCWPKGEDAPRKIADAHNAALDAEREKNVKLEITIGERSDERDILQEKVKLLMKACKDAAGEFNGFLMCCDEKEIRDSFSGFANAEKLCRKALAKVREAK